MLNVFRATRSNILVWIMIGLLIVGLAGIGIGVGSIGGGAVARVGDRSVSTDDFLRTIDQEMRSIASQIGRGLTMTEARQFGVDRMVLSRLISDAAIDNEADRLGLSSGDRTVQALVLASPAFQGVDGNFDRDSYAFALDRAGLNAGDFEELLRREATRELIAASVQAPTTAPDAAASLVLDFLGERRSFEWLSLTPSQLSEPTPEPDAAQIEAEYQANPERYTRPEIRRIVYASLTLESLAETLAPTEDELRAAYEAQADRFNLPERRILDRIGFGTEAEAQEARTRLDAGETDFDALAAERGLDADAIDQGILAQSQLAASARHAVFGTEDPGVVGPVPTPLGPSLYRVNAILLPTSTPFDEARAEIARELSLSRAQDEIADEARRLDDLVAGGATVEEIAAETALELGALDLTAESAGGLADDPAFREIAETATIGQETDPAELTSGGIFTLRLDEIIPPAPIPLEEARDAVAADWRRDQIAAQLAQEAEGLAEELGRGVPLAEIGERLETELGQSGPILRSDAPIEIPQSLVAAIFDAAPESAVVFPDGDGIILARVTDVASFDPALPENTGIAENLSAQFRAQTADDILALYTAALRDTAGVSVNQSLIDSALSQFP